MSSLFSLTTESDGGIVRIVLAGELDIANAEQVEQSFAALEREQPKTVVLDLRSLTFMDSTGLRLIVAADARAREDGRRLVVVRGPEPIQRILHMTRLDERLEIVDDPPAAQAG